KRGLRNRRSDHPGAAKVSRIRPEFASAAALTAYNPRRARRKLRGFFRIPRCPMAGKLFIKTHGCQMNEYDSTKMADVLAASHGLEVTANEAEADVILINTCSIREKAQEKVFSQLGRWR